MSLKLSILDLAFIPEGGNAREALAHSLDLARHAELWGYERFWLAEHHNMPGIASAATAVAIGHIAAGTDRIRVGAGGIMLPNHAPLVIAEQFGTLETLYPGRIDLGLGRAPGTDGHTLQALRRSAMAAEQFPRDVVELQGYFGPLREGQRVQAVPGTGLNVPLWILGSSLFGARLAARLGLPYAFASHFAPQALDQALDVYRREFRPSDQLQAPYTMAGVNVIAAATDEEATRLFSSVQQLFARMVRGTPGQLAAPVADIEQYWSPVERSHAMAMLACAFVGSQKRVQEELARFARDTGVDEVMAVSAIYDHRARLESYRLLAEGVISP